MKPSFSLTHSISASDKIQQQPTEKNANIWSITKKNAFQSIYIASFIKYVLDSHTKRFSLTKISCAIPFWVSMTTVDLVSKRVVEKPCMAVFVYFGLLIKRVSVSNGFYWTLFPNRPKIDFKKAFSLLLFVGLAFMNDFFYVLHLHLRLQAPLLFFPSSSGSRGSASSVSPVSPATSLAPSHASVFFPFLPLFLHLLRLLSQPSSHSISLISFSNIGHCTLCKLCVICIICMQFAFQYAHKGNR